jgi:hypothetical protein
MKNKVKIIWCRLNTIYQKAVPISSYCSVTRNLAFLDTYTVKYENVSQEITETL